MRGVKGVCVGEGTGWGDGMVTLPYPWCLIWVQGDGDVAVVGRQQDALWRRGRLWRRGGGGARCWLRLGA